MHVRFWELFWPFVLIMIGVSLATQALQPRRVSAAGGGKERFSLFAVMSGRHVHEADTSPFRGADMSALMGGGQLDLRQATIPPGEEATIDIYGLMSGFEIFVPSHWQVSTGIVPFMASVEDKRLPPLGLDTDPSRATATPRLVVHGFIMMGSVEIKS